MAIVGRNYQFAFLARERSYEIGECQDRGGQRQRLIPLLEEKAAVEQISYDRTAAKAS